MNTASHSDDHEKTNSVFIKMFIPQSYERDRNAQIIFAEITGNNIPYDFVKFLVESSYTQRIKMFDGLICGNWVDLEIKPKLSSTGWEPEFVNYVILSNLNLKGDNHG